MRCKRVAPVLMFAAAKRRAATPRQKRMPKNVRNLFKRAGLLGIQHQSWSVGRKNRQTKMTQTHFYNNAVKRVLSVFGLVCPTVGAASFFSGTFINHSESLNTRRSNAFAISQRQVPLESASFNSPVEKLSLELDVWTCTRAVLI